MTGRGTGVVGDTLTGADAAESSEKGLMPFFFFSRIYFSGCFLLPLCETDILWCITVLKSFISILSDRVKEHQLLSNQTHAFFSAST